MTNKSIKILAIGNSFSQDATTYLRDIFTSAKFQKVIVANMYIGGCSLDTHWANMQGDIDAYEYQLYNNDVHTVTNNTKLSTVICAEDWDIITIQQASGVSGVPSSYDNLDNVINYVNNHKTNPNAKIFWHMTWAYAQTSDHCEFVNYGNDQRQMYQAIVDTVKQKILTNTNIQGVIPCGTAVQNLRESDFGDNLCRDGFHMSYDIGRYLTALTWFAKLSNQSLENTLYLPTDELCANNILPHISKIKQSVTNAIAHPYDITPCK